MKIGFFTDSYLPNVDGVATSVASSAKELEKLGHEVYIIAPRSPKYKDKKNVYRLMSVRLYEKPEIRMGLQLPQRSLLRIMRIDFDIIHSHSGGPISFLGWQISQLRNVPYVATYHTLWNKYAHYFLFLKGVMKPKVLEITSALFGNTCDEVIAPTEKVKDELLKYGVKKPIHVIPSGIYVEKFGKQRRGFLRELLTIPKRDKIVLTVSRLGREKSVDFLIKVFAHIYKNQPDVHLVCVGDGPDRDSVEKLIEKLGVGDRVHLTGPIEHQHMPRVYADAEVFIFASQTETQGMVVLEAMASRLPVVVVHDKAYKEVVEDGVNGYIVKKNEKLFAEKVLGLLAYKEMRVELGKNGRKTAENYSVHYTARALEHVYQRLVLDQVAERTNWKKVVKSLNSDIVHLLKVPAPQDPRAYLNLRELNRIKDTIREYLIG